MKRLLVFAVVGSFFAFGFTQCDPHPSCAHPKVLAGYQGTLHYPPYVVQQDVWQQVGEQTMYVCGPGDWKAVANQSGPPEAGVRAYPDSQKTYSDWQSCSSQPTLGSFTKLATSWSHVTPVSGSWNAAIDVFLNGAVCGKPTTEIMAWDRWRAISVPTAQLHPVIGGVAWDLYYHGTYFQFRRHTQTNGGTVNVLALLRYLQSRGFLSSADTLQFVAGGFELLTTFGHDTPFSLTGFSVSDAHS